MLKLSRRIRQLSGKGWACRKAVSPSKIFSFEACGLETNSGALTKLEIVKFFTKFLHRKKCFANIPPDESKAANFLGGLSVSEN